MYGGIAGFLSINVAETREMIDSILIGGVLADYVTWLIRSIILLPSNILHGCYDVGVNFLFGWFLASYMFSNPDLHGQVLGIAFLAFILVMGAKITYYSVKYLGEENE
ncbi:MAG: hypothetical protein PHR77_14095 [Kiritimatiellae bacterium]|nr:hypothetical protein [Kiritimatiellia bacterium]